MVGDETSPEEAEARQGELAGTQRERVNVPLAIVQGGALLVLLGWIFVLRRPLGHPPEWSYRVNEANWSLLSLLPVIGVTGALVGACCLLVRRHARAERELAANLRGATAALIVIGLPAMQVALLAMNPIWMRVLVAYQMSDVSTGYLREAYHIEDATKYVREFPRTMDQRPRHLRTRPPGITLIYYGLRRLCERLSYPAYRVSDVVLRLGRADEGSVLRYASQFPGGRELGRDAIPVALLATALFGLLSAGAAAVVFWVLSSEGHIALGLIGAAIVGLSPAAALCSQCPDMLLVMAAAVAVACLWTERPSLWRGAVAGAVIALSLLCSLSAVALLGAVGVALVARTVAQARRGKASRGVIALAGLAAGFVAVCLMAYLAGLNVLAVGAAALRDHAAQAGAESERTYAVWVWLNVVEFAVFHGLAGFVLVCWRARGWWTALWQRRVMMPAALGLAALACLVLLSLSGIVRGETGRMLAPLMILTAAPAVYSTRGRWALVLTAAMVFAQTVCMSLAMQPVNTPF